MKKEKVLLSKRVAKVVLILLLFMSSSFAVVLQDIASLQNHSPINDTIIKVLGYNTLNDGGGGDFYWDSSSEEDADGGTIFESSVASNGRWKRIQTTFNAGTVSVKWFGAMGKCKTYDQVGIQNALNSNAKTIFFPEGIYLIATQLVSGSENRVITSEGNATIISNVNHLFMLAINGKNTTVSNLIFDGNNCCANAISVKADGFIISDNKIKNLKTNATGCIGISVSARGEGRIERNKITNIFSPSDGIPGNIYGSARGISVDADTADRYKSIIIKNNYIDSIYGEEGDGIHIKAGDWAHLFPKTYKKGLAIIDGNYIKSCSRRGIKIQSSNNIIRNNTYDHILPTNASDNFASGIDIISSNNNTISDNIVDGTASQGITITGHENASLTTGNIIQNNRVSCGYNVGGTTGTQAAIRVKLADETVISGNYIVGGYYGCEIIDSDRTVVDNNIDLGLSQNSHDFIKFDINCNTYTCRNNTGLSQNFKRYQFIYSDADNGVISGNTIRYSNGSSGTVVSLSYSAENNLLINNTPNVISAITSEE